MTTRPALLSAALLFALVLAVHPCQAPAGESPADPNWRWWQWPSKEVVFHGLAKPEPFPAEDGAWMSKVNIKCLVTVSKNGTIVFSAPTLAYQNPDGQEVSSLLRAYSITSLVKLCPNLFPYWDGAASTLDAMLQDPSPTRELQYNQYTIQALNVGNGATILIISRRKDFEWEALRARATGTKD